MKRTRIQQIVRSEISEQAILMVSHERPPLNEGFFGDVRDKFLQYFKSNKKEPVFITYAKNGMRTQVLFVENPKTSVIYRVEVDKGVSKEPVKISKKEMKIQQVKLEADGYKKYSKRDLVKKGVVRGFLLTVVPVLMAGAGIAAYIGSMILFGMYGDSVLSIEGNEGNSIVPPTNDKQPTSLDQIGSRNGTFYEVVPPSAEAGEVVTVYKMNPNGGQTTFDQLLEIKRVLESGEGEVVMTDGTVTTNYDTFVNRYFPDLKTNLTIADLINKVGDRIDTSTWKTSSEFR